MGVQVQHAHPQALADRSGAGHAQVAGERGLMAAAQHHGKLPASSSLVMASPARAWPASSASPGAR